MEKTKESGKTQAKNWKRSMGNIEKKGDPIKISFWEQNINIKEEDNEFDFVSALWAKWKSLIIFTCGTVCT